MYEIAISFVSCFIVWLVWFLIAKEKHNHGHMIFSTQFCCFAFIVLAWGVLCGAVCLGAYALINYIKKSFPEFPKEEKENEHNPQQIQAPTKNERCEKAPSSDNEDPHLHRKEILDSIKKDTVEEKPKLTGNQTKKDSPLAVFFWVFMVLLFAFLGTLIVCLIIALSYH